MRPPTRFLAWTSLLVVGACAEPPGAPPLQSVAPLATVSHAPTGGTQGFYFLPPTVRSQSAFAGTFDPARSPTIRVTCTGASGPNCPTVASFAMGTGPNAIKLDATSESYALVWHTPSTLTLGRLMYRVQVLDGASLLGSADISVVSKQNETMTLPATEVGLVRGSPFHVKFRIEKSTLAPAVTAQLTPTGGTIDVPLGTGSSLKITVPAGALKEPVGLTIAPKTPRPGSLAAVSISPSNLLFLRPITLSLTIGSSVPAGSAAGKSLVLFSAPRTLVLPTSVTVGALTTTFTASTAVLGNPQPVVVGAAMTATARQALASMNVADAPTEVEVLQATTAEKVAAYRSAAAELEATLSFESAIQLRLAAAVLNQLIIDDPAAAAIDLVAARNDACNALDKHLTLAEGRLGSNFSNLWSAIRPILSWQAATAELNVNAGNCAAAADAPVKVAEMVTRFESLYTEAMNRESFKLNADALGVELWEALRVRQLGQLLGLPVEFATIKNTVQLPLAEKLRKASYDWCRTDIEQMYSGRLLRAARDGGMYPPGSPELARLLEKIEDRLLELGYDETDLSEDVHQCGTDITVHSKRKNGAVIAQVPLGGDVDPGNVRAEQTVNVSPEGTVELSGTFLAFTCPDGSIGNDRAVFEFNGVNVREFPPVAPTSAFIRSTPETFNVRALAQAAGVSVSDGGTFPLRIYRRSDACSGEYKLATDTELKLLATLSLTFPTISVTVQPGSVTVSAGGTAQFGVIVSGGDNTVVTWTATGGTINIVGTYVAGAAAGTYTVTATSVADPNKKGTATVTISGGGGGTQPPGSQFTLEQVGAPQFDAPLNFRLTVVSLPSLDNVQWTATASSTFPGAGDLNAFIAPVFVGPFDVNEFTRRWEGSVGYPRTWFNGNIGYRVTITVRACGFSGTTPLLNITGGPLCVQRQVTP